MPSIGRQAVTSARGFGAFTVLSGPFWIGAITKSGTAFQTRSITVDSEGNVIVTGNPQGSGGAQIIKISPLGILLWQKELSTAGSSDIIMDCACVNIPGGGYNQIYAITTNGSGDNILFRVDSDGTLNYQKYYGGGFSGTRLNSIPSDQVVVVGQIQATTLEALHLVYTLSNGTLFYQSQIGDTSKDIALTGTNNPYPGGNYLVVGRAGDALYLVSPVGNGNLNWQKQLNPSGSEVTTWADVVNGSTGNFAYVVASATSALLVARYDSISTFGATLAWQRQFTISINSIARFRIARDSLNNVYCVGVESTVGTFICKYSSSGNLIWQRSISNSSAFDICIYNDAMYITAEVVVSGKNSIVVFKLPTSGGLLGTYSIGGTSITYAATSFTEGAGTWTESTPSYSNNTTSRSNGTSSNTYSNGANTLTVTNI